MKLVPGAVYALILILLAPPVYADEEDLQAVFAQLMQESGLIMGSREGFSDIPIQENPVMPYEHAMRHQSGALELRFIVRPLGRITIDYTDPHNAAPEPNHLFPLLFESVTNQLAAGSVMPSSILSESEAKESFNADWAAVAVFDINPAFASGYKNALLVGMHRNQLADAYTLFLFNDYAQTKPFIDDSISIMSFAP